MTVSVPGPPLRSSFPPSPQMKSPPGPPFMWSTPELPTITSFPGVPWIVPAPTIVAGTSSPGGPQTGASCADAVVHTVTTRAAPGCQGLLPIAALSLPSIRRYAPQSPDRHRRRARMQRPLHPHRVVAGVDVQRRRGDVARLVGEEVARGGTHVARVDRPAERRSLL